MLILSEVSYNTLLGVSLCFAIAFQHRCDPISGSHVGLSHPVGSRGLVVVGYGADAGL